MSVNVATVVEPLELRSYNFSSKGKTFMCSEHVAPVPSFVQESLQNSDFNLEMSWNL